MNAELLLLRRRAADGYDLGHHQSNPYMDFENNIRLVICIQGRVEPTWNLPLCDIAMASSGRSGQMPTIPFVDLIVLHSPFRVLLLELTETACCLKVFFWPLLAVVKDVVDVCDWSEFNVSATIGSDLKKIIFHSEKMGLTPRND